MGRHSEYRTIYSFQYPSGSQVYMEKQASEEDYHPKFVAGIYQTTASYRLEPVDVLPLLVGKGFRMQNSSNFATKQ